MKQYEAMFVFDPTFGSTFEACDGEVRRLMERAEAEIVVCRKWDERRLAYRIDGRKRGVYVLTYFKAPPDNIKKLERDAKLSESILRLLVLSAEEVSSDAMERAFAQRPEDSERPEGSGVASKEPATPRAAAPASSSSTATIEAPTQAVADAPATPKTDEPATAKTESPDAQRADEPATPKTDDPDPPAKED